MTKDELIGNALKLYRSAEDTFRQRVRHALESGAITPNDWAEGYQLPRVLLEDGLLEIIRQWRATAPKARRCVRNLRKF